MLTIVNLQAIAVYYSGCVYPFLLTCWWLIGLLSILLGKHYFITLCFKNPEGLKLKLKTAGVRGVYAEGMEAVASLAKLGKNKIPPASQRVSNLV